LIPKKVKKKPVPTISSWDRITPTIPATPSITTITKINIKRILFMQSAQFLKTTTSLLTIHQESSLQNKINLITKIAFRATITTTARQTLATIADKIRATMLAIQIFYHQISFIIWKKTKLLTTLHKQIIPCHILRKDIAKLAILINQHGQSTVLSASDAFQLMITTVPGLEFAFLKEIDYISFSSFVHKISPQYLSSTR